MCGIAGAVSFNGSVQTLMPGLNAAVHALNRRGPDHQACAQVNDHVALGHRRLSIIDLNETGNQPMFDQSREACITFNGEIYNYRQLGRGLHARYAFSGSSDTEVLLHHLIDQGEQALSELNGFFALAYFDKKTDKLLLARDRFGIKPLYYYKDDDQLLFASELKAILQWPIERKLNKRALNEYLQLNYVPAPLSILENVQILMPGQKLVLDLKSKALSTSHFYRVEPVSVSASLSEKEAIKQLDSLLKAAVSDRLVADVPVGGFLSGGLDSTAIASYASEQVDDFRTFSIGFKDNPQFDESAAAEETAKFLGTNHQTWQLTTDDLLHQVDSVLNYSFEPFADSSSIAVHLLSSLVTKEMKVVLSGDGGDELFGGYHKHLALQRSVRSSFMNLLVRALPGSMIPNGSRESKIGNLLRQLKRYKSGLHLCPELRQRKWCKIASQAQINQILRPEYQLEHSSIDTLDLSSEVRLQDFLDADLRTVLPDDMLTKVDRMSMAQSLEVRVPFLDFRLVDFVRKLPDNYKLRNSEGKWILRRTIETRMPKTLLNRPKRGFEVPIAEWLRTSLASKVQKDLLDHSFIQEQGIFNFEGLQQLVNQLHSRQVGDAAARIWALIVFQSSWKKILNEV